MHRITILVKAEQKEIQHESIVKLIWQILEEGNKELAFDLHSRKERRIKYQNFVWGSQKYDDKNMITFASLDEIVVGAFWDGCQKIGDECLLIDNTIFSIKQIFPLRNIQYIGNQVMLRTISPITLTERYLDEKKQKLKYRAILYDVNPKKWINTLELSLQRKTNELLNTDIEKPRIILLNNEKTVAIKYKNGLVHATYLELKIKGDELAIKTALYNGIGIKSGLGFGLVTIL